MVAAVASIGSSSGQTEAIRLQVPLQKQPYNLCLPASILVVLGYRAVEIAPEEILAHVPIYNTEPPARTWAAS